MERVILLDADIPVFMFAASNQTNVSFDGEKVHNILKPYGYVTDQMDSYIKELKENLGCDRMVVCLSDKTKPNFRYGVLPTYKHNRKSSIDPVYRERLNQYLLQKYECWTFPGLEGDDVMGILATDPDSIPGKKVIVSIDKDMKTIPTRVYKGQSVNWLFNPNKDKKPRKISEDQADYFWMLQTLMGDTTDGYTGIPGIGEKRALKILGPADEGYLSLWWDLVVDAYEAKGLTKDDAIVQATVARILRAEDYFQETGVIIPWLTR